MINVPKPCEEDYIFSHLSDLTEEERIICGQSAQFEDFVVQFLDRCFTLINSSSLEETRVEMSSSDHRTTRDESLKDVGLASTISAILTQVNLPLIFFLSTFLTILCYLLSAFSQLLWSIGFSNQPKKRLAVLKVTAKRSFNFQSSLFLFTP